MQGTVHQKTIHVAPQLVHRCVHTSTMFELAILASCTMLALTTLLAVVAGA